MAPLANTLSHTLDVQLHIGQPEVVEMHGVTCRTQFLQERCVGSASKCSFETKVCLVFG